MKICYVVGAAPFARAFSPNEDDLVIAADGGWKSLLNMGIRPHLVVGDFDSAEAPDDIPVLRYPIEKDDTDTALAIKEGVRRGYECFALYGCAGGRADQTLANIQTLHHLAIEGFDGYLVDENTVSTVVANKALHFKPKGKVSVFSLTNESLGVTIDGLYYPLRNARLTNDCPLGVSNEGNGQAASVSVKQGVLYVMWEG